MVRAPGSCRGVTLTEVMVTVAVIGIVMSVGSTLFLRIFRFWQVEYARTGVQRNARISLDTINRLLRQATSSSVSVSQLTDQPPYSWITFSITKGTGPAIGDYGFFQEGKYLRYMHDGATSTLADNLRYLAFTYPRTDNEGIISVSMTFEQATYAGYKKALQLSIEKVRVMN